MRAEEGIVVAVDESEAAERALRYVGRIVGSCRGLKVRLLHLLPPYPRGAIEHGGAEEPEREVALEEDMEEAQEEWIARKEKEAEPLFDRARAVLEEEGASPASVETVVGTITDEKALARKCLDTARASGYRTIALGRSSLSGLKELFHRHPSDELVRQAEGFTIWVVD